MAKLGHGCLSSGIWGKYTYNFVKLGHGYLALGFLGKYTSFLFLWVNIPGIWLNLKKLFHFPNMCVNNNKEDH